MHERVRNLLASAAALVAVTALSGCSAIRVQPAYGACGGSQTNPSCAIVGDRVEVAYEARCDGECTARFQLPDANYGRRASAAVFGGASPSI